MKIYVASSWRNPNLDSIVDILRQAGHIVYNFKETISTTEKTSAFNWDQIDPSWENWTSSEFAEHINDVLAVNAFEADSTAMKEAEACVLVLPCGLSAHIEAGYMKGLGKKVFILLTLCRPELTYRIFDGLAANVQELLSMLGREN